jgi:MFS family permease
MLCKPERMPRSPLWRHRDFMRLWVAETISQLGTGVTLLALPLVAIEVLDASAPEVGALTAVEFAPFILVGLPAGVWVDRLRRKPVLVAGDLGRALVLASIPIAYALDVLTMWQLYAVAFVAGVLTVFFDVAYQSYLPSLVEKDMLADGNSKLEISRSGAQIAGPGIAGALIGAVTAPGAIVVDAVSFLLSGGAIFRIRAHEQHEPVPKSDRPRMRTEIAEGLRYVWGHRYLRPIAMATATSNLFNSMAGAVTVLFMVRTLDLSAGLIGLVFAVGNLGFLAGAALAAAIGKSLGVGRTIVMSIGLGSPFAFFVPLSDLGPALPWLMVGLVFASMGGVVYNISQVSLRQAICPDRLLGRMNASMRFMVWGTLPVGAAIGGALGGAIGLKPTLFIGAAGQCLAWVPPALSPVWRLRTIAEAEEEEEALAAARDGGVVPASAPASGLMPETTGD